MTNPVLVEIIRGGRVESRHRGAAVVVDSDGKPLISIGDVELPIYPRSAIKAMQAVCLVESGAADALGFGDRELSLASASHNGEPDHVNLAASMLKRVGRTEADLQCGCHWPSRIEIAVALARTGTEPSQLHHNCSGKHAGFVCTACHLGVDPSGYVRYGHEVQDMVRDVMVSLTGEHYGVENCAIDGCSVPTYAVPLNALARGFAKMATGNGLAPGRAAASQRLLTSCMKEPYFVAGAKRACTRLMKTAPGRIFAKTGAEGVFCAALPDLGIGIAAKCDDGASRAADAVVAALLAKILESDAETHQALMEQANRPIRNWKGLETGSIRVVDGLADGIVFH